MNAAATPAILPLHLLPVAWFSRPEAAHSGSAAMAAATPALGELIAESELTVGEPVSAKGMPG